MEDIRKLMQDHEAEIAPESLGYLVHGLTAVINELLREGAPSEPGERYRYREMLGSCARLAETYAAMLSRWLGEHRDRCGL